MTAAWTPEIKGRQLGGSMTNTDATATYRGAKKTQAVAAIRVGALESEIASLASRKVQLQRTLRDTAQLDLVITRTTDKLATAERDFEEARDAYRVAHLELLMTPGPQRHYVDSISKQRLIARIAQDDNETAILMAMQNTLALVMAMIIQRENAHTWKINAAQDPETGDALTEMESAAAQAGAGIYRSPRGAITEVTRLSDGQIGTPRGPLGPIPYFYVPGAPFANGHLMLNNALRLQRKVDPAEPTGYAAARSIIV